MATFLICSTVCLVYFGILIDGARNFNNIKELDRKGRVYKEFEIRFIGICIVAVISAFFMTLKHYISITDLGNSILITTIIISMTTMVLHISSDKSLWFNMINIQCDLIHHKGSKYVGTVARVSEVVDDIILGSINSRRYKYSSVILKDKKRAYVYGEYKLGDLLLITRYYSGGFYAKRINIIRINKKLIGRHKVRKQAKH